jgi:predicted phage tail component-like protein
MITYNYNDIYSSDLNIIVVKDPPIPIPERNIESIDVLGRNGSLTIDNESYKDVAIPFICNVNSDNLEYLSTLIADWLSNPGGKLIRSDLPNFHYRVKKIDKFDIQRSILTLGEFNVNFTCEPFKYSNLVEIISLTNSGSTIMNPGSAFSDPILDIYGSGDVSINIGSQTVTLTGLNEHVTVDSIRQDCYKDTVLKNSSMTGEFIKLPTGSFNVSWTGNITKLDITPNWRWK